MLSKTSVRWAIVLVFLAVLLGTPKPVFAGMDCGALYQTGGNCCNYQYDPNCYYSQNNTDYSNNQYGTSCTNTQYGSPCYSSQQGGTIYAPYTGPIGGTYLVQWGDTMRIIADRFGIPLENLLAANPQLWNPDMIYAGQVINLPSSNIQPAYYPQGVTYGPSYPQGMTYGPGYYPQGMTYGPSYPQGQYYGPGYNQQDYPDSYYKWHKYHQYQSNYYTVQAKDTLKTIAATYDTTVDALLKLNPSLLGVPGRIHKGLTLLIR